MDEKFAIRTEDVATAHDIPQAPDEEIITTPLIESAWQLYNNCRTANAIGVIQGPSGTGKSSALKAIVSRHVQNQFPGTVHRIKCCKASGPSSGVRAILLDLGIGGAVTSNRTVAGLHYLLKLATRELGQRNIAALLLDDADYYEPDTLLGIIALFDQLRESKSPLTLIFTGVSNESKWIGQIPAATTRTLHLTRSTVMDFAMTAAVLKHMGISFEKLVLAQESDSKARAALRLIHKETGGIFRRVRYFADLANARNPEELTLEVVESILEQMQN